MSGSQTARVALRLCKNVIPVLPAARNRAFCGLRARPPDARVTLNVIRIIISITRAPIAREVHANLSVSSISERLYSRLCDADGDRDVDQNDINTLILAKGTVADPGDIKDFDVDGVITTLDARECFT
jgi:hypothetical protein